MEVALNYVTNVFDAFYDRGSTFSLTHLMNEEAP